MPHPLLTMLKNLVRTAAGCLLLVAAVHAGPLRLTMRDAVNLALKQNPQVIAGNLNVVESQEDRAIARSGLLPKAGFEGSQRVTRANIESAFGQRIPGFPQHIGPYWVTQAGVGGSAPIFDLTLWRRYQASKQDVEAARSQELTIREQAVLLVVSQYLGGQRAAADVKAAQSRVDLAQALFTQAGDLQAAGVGTGIDTLRANVQLQNERQRLIVARMQLDTALFGLARLLNVPPQQGVEIGDEVGFFDTPEFAADKTLDQAYRARPELREVLSQQAALRLARQGASEARLPTLRFDGGWAYQGLSSSTLVPTYQAGFVLDVPLFTGGRIAAGQARADTGLRKLQQREIELKNRVALEVKTAMRRLEAARSEVDVANSGVKLSQEEVEQARDRFKAGVANNIEVISAQDALARASDNQIAALYRYNQSRADLAHAVGQMELMYK
jgi:outer membrane protein